MKKKFFFLKNQKNILKNTEFHTDFESVGKVVKKKHTKKLLTKQV